MNPTWKPFSSLPVGSTFEIPGDPPIRVKINADTACWHADWIERKGREPEVREGAAVYHHGDPWEMVLAPDHVRRCEAPSTCADKTFQNPLSLTESYRREIKVLKGLLREIDSVLDSHFGPFRRFESGAIPDRVRQLALTAGRGKQLESLLRCRANDAADLARENAKIQQDLRSMTRNSTMQGARARRAEAEVQRLEQKLRRAEAEIVRQGGAVREGAEKRTGPKDRRVRDIPEQNLIRRSSHGRRQGDRERADRRLPS